MPAADAVERATGGGTSASRSRPPGTLVAFLACVLAIWAVDAVDGGLSSAALSGAGVMAVFVLGVLLRVRAAWIVLVVLQCGNIAVVSGRGEWLLVAGDLVLLVLLVARPTRNYVLHREDSGKAQ